MTQTWMRGCSRLVRISRIPCSMVASPAGSARSPRSFVGDISVGQGRDRAREVNQRVIEIERVAPDAARVDLNLVGSDDFRLQSGVAFGGDGLVASVDEVLRKLGDAVRCVNPYPVE